MKDSRSPWQVIAREARICLRLYFLPLTLAWRWLRRITRR